TLAEYLFGNVDRLLRFDMNEYVSLFSVTQLVGTFHQPEGLLTAFVRRQPFAVILFDEIEKAHPDVFDLLLQVLGEGRLTDARGRTTDFSNTIILLTSNLGTRRQSAGLGFGDADNEVRDSSLRAVENFFRPEFVNRLDRIIPFGRLAEAEMHRIARFLITDVLNREGLVRRRCLLNITPAALSRVVRRGYDPALGARALRRAIETEVTQPIAEFLAAHSGNKTDQMSLTLIDVTTSAESHVPKASVNPERLSVDVKFLQQKPVIDEPVEATNEPSELMAKCQTILDDLTGRMQSIQSSGPISAGNLNPQQIRYFLLQDECASIREKLQVLEEAIRRDQSTGRTTGLGRPGRSTPIAPSLIRRKGPSHGNVVSRSAADDAIDDFFEQDAHIEISDFHIATESRNIFARLRWLQAIAQATDEQLTETVQVRIHGLHPLCAPFVQAYARRLQDAWSDELALETSVTSEGLDSNEVTVQLYGPLASHFASVECGYHLVEENSGDGFQLIHVHGTSAGDQIVRKLRTSPDGPQALLPAIEELRLLAWNQLEETRP
ncbi:MAG: ATP-dependent Clp protease ATP-binding subunit, partial [Planctomycetaceae bacterium]|nr:ATP-dependent Clp protease ATP-binding subunit [Planctomycetaceae bacterium]